MYPELRVRLDLTYLKLTQGPIYQVNKGLLQMNYYEIPGKSLHMSHSACVYNNFSKNHALSRNREMWTGPDRAYLKLSHGPKCEVTYRDPFKIRNHQIPRKSLHMNH